MQPISNNPASLPPIGLTSGISGPAKADSGGDFANLFLKQLQEVSAAQAAADDGVQRVLTGQSDNLGEVFVATRKAEVAFSLLMELRNKLVDAYEELRQLRV